MGVVVKEALDTRPVRNSHGEWTGLRRFHVWNDTSALTTPVSVAALFGSNGLPNYRDQFPDAGIPLLATNPVIERQANHPDLWTVTWEYTQGSLIQSQQKEVQDTGYVDISGDVSGEFVDTWRAVPSSTLATLVASGGTYAFGTPASSFNDDIGGTAIDVAGEPVSMLNRMADVQFSVVSESVPNLGFIGGFVGRRNSVAFNGAAKGKVVFLGASPRRIAPRKWSIQFRFRADEFYHMRQVPRVNPDGQPYLGSFVNGGIHAQYVYYIQPFPDFANFYLLSPYLNGVA